MALVRVTSSTTNAQPAARSGAASGGGTLDARSGGRRAGSGEGSTGRRGELDNRSPWPPAPPHPGPPPTPSRGAPPPPPPFPPIPPAAPAPARPPPRTTPI